MKKPTLLAIFDSLNYTENISPGMTRLQELFSEKLHRICPASKDHNEIEAAVNELLCESQYMGFVQGFDLARSLFCGKYI